MQGILYEEHSIWLFLLVTVVMGGWAAWMTGRALALTWKPLSQVAFAAFGLSLVVRFIHFALFGGTLRSLQFLMVDFAVVLIFALLGYRYTRTRQMTTQYRWLYEKAGPFSWREKRVG
ncbi:MAG: DUF6867 family protein [Beijerinckiaceae bacterium]